MNEDKATRYQRLKRQARIQSAALSVLFLASVAGSGAATWLRDAALGIATGSWFPATIVFVTVLVVIHDALLFPLAFRQGVTLERHYGLLAQSTARWAQDHVKSLMLGWGAAVVSAVAVQVLWRTTGNWWWLWAGILALAALIGLAHLAPLLLLPLMDRTAPLARPELAARLMRLASRANARVVGVFEWHLSARTTTANAVLAGLGRTRRILVSDTLLASHSDDEIEVILAHELAHHVHHDLWSALAVDAVLVLFGAFVADGVVGAAIGPLSLQGKGDLAALPLLALVVAIVSMGLTPLANALSRAHERRADRYALDLTGNATAFVSAMRRLAAQNLADDRPSRLVEWCFYTHPPVADRIEAARTWAAQKG
mgnify:FL=1